jgi:hypothetical protein
VIRMLQQLPNVEKCAKYQIRWSKLMYEKMKILN